MLELARTKTKRALIEHKKSSFRVNKKPVDDRKIERYLQRKDISQEELLALISPVDGWCSDLLSCWRGLTFA